MDFEQTIAGARDAITVRRVYGEPFERNGVTVIPAAAISDASSSKRAWVRAAGCGS